MSSILDDKFKVNKQNGHWSYLNIVIFVAALTSMFKYLHFIFSLPGLCLMLLAGSAICFFRYKHFSRKESPKLKSISLEIRKRDFKKIGQWLDKNIIGQSKGITKCLEQVYNRVYFNRKDGHLGSYLLFGPTGTGKTFFAKLLSEGLFGSKCFVHVPLNQTDLGANEVLSIIVTAMEEKESLVILLDEIDKAAPGVTDALYHFLETGKLMNPKNQEWVYCPSMVVIATTNAGYLQGQTKESLASMEHFELLEHINKKSKLGAPLLSRFDGIYYFAELGPTETAKVALMQLKKHYSQHDLDVTFLCAEFVAEIVKENRRFQEFGVRQLLQVVRLKAEKIILEAKKKGIKEIEVSFENKQFIVKQKSFDSTYKRAA